jgi:hypothetical protein
MYVEHEYARGGAWAYLAAWDMHRAQVFGRCESTTGITVRQGVRIMPTCSARVAPPYSVGQRYRHNPEIGIVHIMPTSA